MFTRQGRTRKHSPILILCNVILVITGFACTALAQVKPTMGYAEINGGKLYYEMMGTGDALVLIHGGLLNSKEWDCQFEDLAKAFTVIRYDIRGYGKSDVPKRYYSNRGDLYSLLKFLNVDRGCIIGESFGGGYYLPHEIR